MSVVFDVGVSRAEFSDDGVTPPLLELVVVRSRSQRILQPRPEAVPCCGGEFECVDLLDIWTCHACGWVTDEWGGAYYLSSDAERNAAL